MKHHRVRPVVALLLVGAWTLAFLGVMQWDRATLAEMNAGGRDGGEAMGQHMSAETKFDGLLWLLGTGGILFSFFWFRRIADARERMREELLRNQQDLTSVLSAIDDLVFGLDPAGRVEVVPGAADLARAFGTTSSMQGRPLEEFLAAPAVAAIRHAQAAVIATGQPQECDFVSERGAQTVHWNARLTLRRAVDGNAGVTVVARDATRRGLAEAALRDSEERWRLIYECSAEGILLSRPDGQYVAANRAACAMLGMTEAEIIAHGRGVFDDAARPGLEPLIQQRRLTGTVRGELVVRRKDGTPITVEGSSSLITLSDGQPRAVTIFRDITARRRAEESARENALRWEAAMEAAGDGLWDWNVMTKEVFYSDTLKAMLGYAPAEFGPHVDEWESRLHPDDRAAVLAQLQRHLAGETEVYACEHRLRCRDGSYKWIADRGRVVSRLPDGTALRMIGTHKDLTPIRAAAQALQESEERYRTLFESATDPILACPILPDGRLGGVCEANEAARALLGYPREELEQLSPLDFEAPEFRRTVPDRLEQIQRTGRAFFETEVCAKDGSRVPIEVNAQVFVRRGQSLLLSTIRDLRQRKQAESAMAHLADERQAILDTLAVGVALLKDRQVQWWNRSFEQLAGLDERGLLDRRAEALYARREDYERVGAEAYPRLAQGKSYTTEAEFRRRDGSTLWVRLVGRAINPADAVAGSIWTVEDITARRTAELALRASESELQAIMTSSIDGILAVGLDGKIIRCNRRLLELWNMPAELAAAATSTPLLEWCLEMVRDPLPYKQRVEEIKATTDNSSDELELADGRVFDRTSTPLMADGRMIGRVWAFRDSTARVRMERALRAGEARLAATISAISDLIFVLDTKGRFVDAHCPPGVALVADPDQFLGRTYAEVLPPPVAAQVTAALAALADDGPVQHFDYELVQGGVRTWWNASLSRRTDHAGANIGAVVVVRDISDRVRAEQAQRESEEKFHKAFQYAPLVMVVSNLADGRILEANEFAQRLSGLDPASSLGKSVVDLGWFTESERANLVHLLQTKGRVVDLEMTGRRRDGTAVACLVNCQLVTIAGESRVITTLQDISARKQAEAELRESRENYRGLFNTVTEAIYVHGVDGVFIDVNEGAMRMYGYTREELIGKTPALVSAEGRNDLAAVGRASAEVFATGRPVAFEFWGRRKNGEEFPKACFTHRGTFFGKNVLITTARDMSAQWKAEARIREQAALLDVTQDAVLVLNLDREVTFWNRGAEKLYGISRLQAIGRRFEPLAYRDLPVDYDRDWAKLLEQGDWSHERLQMTETRGAISVQERATLVHDDQGRPRSVLLVVTDVTDAKRLEAQFLRAQRLESLGSLASGIAHDLNNVLTPILMSAGVLADSVRDQHERELIQILNESARRGADIVRQLLLFGRGSESPRAPMSVGRVIKDLVQIMRETFPRGIAISADVPAGLWMIEGDHTQIHQVLLNLGVNARDAMPAGGTLTVRADNFVADPEFVRHQSGARLGPYVRVRVRDTGTGISAANLEKIFDPFFTTKPLGQGTGLGLASSLGIVRSHGGFISVESQEGHGAEFTVHLPAREQPAEAAAPETSGESLRGHAELILVVDDESSIRNALGNALKRAGYRTLLAADGADGVSQFAAHRGEIRLVVTDIMMPVMDGLQAIRAMRQLSPNVPVLAMSGIPSQRAELEAAFGPRLRFLPKPFDFKVTLALMRELLELPAP